MSFNLQLPSHLETLFKIAVHYLIEVFGYTEQQSISTIEEYYQERQNIHVENDVYFDLGPFETAIRIHYFVTLNGDEAGYIFWRRDNNFNRPAPVPKNAEGLWKEFINGR